MIKHNIQGFIYSMKKLILKKDKIVKSIVLIVFTIVINTIVPIHRTKLINKVIYINSACVLYRHIILYTVKK